MMKERLKKIVAFFTSGVVGKAFAVCLLAIIFSMGYASVQSDRNSCYAAVSGGQKGPSANVTNASPAIATTCADITCPTCWWGYCIPWIPCDVNGTASLVKKEIWTAFNTSTRASAKAMEKYIKDTLVDGMMETLLTRLNEAELHLIDWWKTFWWYNLRPGLQAQVSELDATTAQQTRELGSASDAQMQTRIKLERDKKEVDEHRAMRPAENTCVSATLSGGMTRASTFGKAMAGAIQNEAAAPGFNKKGVTGDNGYLEAEHKRYDEYVNIFCNPDDNGGTNTCASSDAKFYNADTKVTKFIYDQLTIDVTNATDGAKMTTTVQALLDNMLGSASTDVIQLGALKTARGKSQWMDRRSFLARYNAIRSAPQMSIGWRMPGSQMGDWVKGLRDASGVAASELSDNPSYHEVMHAVSLDKFNSGKYALGMITDQGEIEKEKLGLSVFYLMQLRDYYELLERQALVLAVQVSLMADDSPLASPYGRAPKR